MPRLFVAIRPPLAVRAQLLALMGGVSGARWQSDEQLHLTLRFIGEIDGHVAEDVAAALASIHHPPFEVALNGIGSFDRRGQPTALWAGVAPHAPLKLLHNKVDQACARAGLAPEGRAYHPHITLARLNRGSGPVAEAVAAGAQVGSAPFTVDSFGLFESSLTPEGAHYAMVARYALG